MSTERFIYEGFIDFSAAFVTANHSILLHRLQHWFGLHGTSLDWFSSYPTSRSQEVSIKNATSSCSNFSCGVPQGSVLGPLLFTLYTTPLGSVISKNSIKYHLYADDTQLYISFVTFQGGSPYNLYKGREDASLAPRSAKGLPLVPLCNQIYSKLPIFNQIPNETG